MEFKEWFSDNQDYRRYYQVINKQLDSVDYLWRAGKIPSNDHWEYGAGGTFFAFSKENAANYRGTPTPYALKRKPTFLIELITSDEKEVMLDSQGMPIGDVKNHAQLLKSNHCESIIVFMMQQPFLQWSIIWLLNDSLSSVLQMPSQSSSL